MTNLTPRNVLICVVPAVILLLSVFWFRKKKKKPDEQQYDHNDLTVPKTVAYDSQNSMYSPVETSLDFANTLSDASSMSSPENSGRNESLCEGASLDTSNTENFSVKFNIEELNITDISFDDENVNCNFHNHNKQKCDDVKVGASLTEDKHAMANSKNAVESNVMNHSSNLESIGTLLKSSNDALNTISFSPNAHEASKSTNKTIITNGIYPNHLHSSVYKPSDQIISNAGKYDFDNSAEVEEEVISKLESSLLMNMFNNQNDSKLLLKHKKLSDADSHSSVLDNSLSSMSDESDRQADFKSKDSPSSVFDGNSIGDESENIEVVNESIAAHLESENNGSHEIQVSYELQLPSSVAIEQYSVQLNKNSFINSILAENEISGSSVDDNETNVEPSLQSSNLNLCDSFGKSVVSAPISENTLTESNICSRTFKDSDNENEKESLPSLKHISSTLETISSTSSNQSCDQTNEQSETAKSLACDTIVSSFTDEVIVTEEPKGDCSDQLSSLTSIQSSLSEAVSFKSQDSLLESLSQKRNLDVGDIKSPGVVPGLFVYEFDLPQELCGRLIGRQGKHVKSIKERTNANVFIKRHPFDTNIKTVVVEGSRAAVFEALDIIRRKYPPSQFPTVTLLQTNMINSPGVSLPESLQLHLPEGASCDVILSSLVSAGHFFLQQPTHPTYPSLSTLDQCMITCYSQMDTPLMPHPVEAGVICAAPVMNGWFRAQVVYVYENSSECEVKFVDYGGFSQVITSSLRQIRSDFMTLPFQASECYLANVRPVDRNAGWSTEATSIFEELAQGQILQALLVQYAEDGVPCVHLYRVQGVSNMFINRELVERGLAVWIDNGHWDPNRPAA